LVFSVLNCLAVKLFRELRRSFNLNCKQQPYLGG
jgi:hypothetical protein